MNERIKALWEQSYKEVIETNDYNGSAYTVREFDQEKFALLIVRECAGIAYEYDIPNLSGLGEFIGNRIKKHFGVEE